MNVDKRVNWDELARSTDEYNGAQLKAVCVETGMIALREGATVISHEHYLSGILEVASVRRRRSQDRSDIAQKKKNDQVRHCPRSPADRLVLLCVARALVCAWAPRPRPAPARFVGDTLRGAEAIVCRSARPSMYFTTCSRVCQTLPTRHRSAAAELHSSRPI